ncbi:VirB3 family type IV secretion system protein [Methylophilus sp. QUAN]|nr:VirB3 family type IV secretion system protein [Methylophilus sp. QUAN]
MSYNYVPRSTRVYRCLNEVKSVAGGERGLVIVNWTIAGATVMGLKTLWWLPAAFFIQIFLVWMYKKDPMSRLIYIRYNSQTDRYDPWPHADTEVNSRPDGFDKGNLC